MNKTINKYKALEVHLLLGLSLQMSKRRETSLFPERPKRTMLGSSLSQSRTQGSLDKGLKMYRRFKITIKFLRNGVRNGLLITFHKYLKTVMILIVSQFTPRRSKLTIMMLRIKVLHGR